MTHRRRPFAPMIAGLFARVAALGLAACANDNAQLRDGDDPLDFTIGGIDLHVASGTALTSGGNLIVYFTDQPDACQAVAHTPVGLATTLRLRITLSGDGRTSADIVSPRPAPAPGQAVGAIVRQRGGETVASIDAHSGAIAWHPNPQRSDGSDGGYTIDSLEVGFPETTDRIRLNAVTIPSCP